MKRLVIDGSVGEGGGQILRSSLALSLLTGTPFTIENIRAKRKKPGLLRQHLTAVRAAKAIGSAKVDGARLGSERLEFRPGSVSTGEHQFQVGTAGSATLVLQTILPALLTTDAPTTLTLEGGTHNAWAPPFDFLEKAFLPLLERMGAKVEAHLDRPGFYPAGGGRFTVTVHPAPRLEPLTLLERGEVVGKRALALVAKLPPQIGEREIARIRKRMTWKKHELGVQEVTGSIGPGNVVLIEIQCEHVTEVFTGFGKRGVPAEAVADEAIKPARAYLGAEAPIGEYLADQLMLPIALAGGGEYRTTTLSRHSTTNLEVLKRFLDLEVLIEEESKHCFRIEMKVKDLP